MVRSIARRFKHPKTGVYWFRKAVPKELQAALGKREHLRSLRTKDPTEARTLHAKVPAEVEKHWKALRPAGDLSGEHLVDVHAGHLHRSGQFQPAVISGLAGDRAAIVEEVNAVLNGRGRVEALVADQSQVGHLVFHVLAGACLPLLRGRLLHSGVNPARMGDNQPGP